MRAAAAACLARMPCGVRVGTGGGSGGAMVALLCWASVKITGCFNANGCREKGWLLIDADHHSQLPGSYPLVSVLAPTHTNRP